MQQRPASQRDQQQSKPVWDIPRPIMQSWSNFITSLNNQQNPDQSASGTLESSPIHYILQSWCHATCQSSRIPHKRAAIQSSNCIPPVPQQEPLQHNLHDNRNQNGIAHLCKILTQSLIPTQLKCNHRIPLQFVNIRPANYRTRPARRAVRRAIATGLQDSTGIATTASSTQPSDLA